MAKFVCDFAEVHKNGEKICELATKMKTAVDEYTTGINNDLLSWKGKAKSSFDETNKSRISQALVLSTYINAIGEYIKTVSSTIQGLEETLSSINID